MPVKTSGIRWRWYVEVLYRWRPLEGTKSTMRLRWGEDERTRERERERAQYRFNDSGSFSIPSTIRTVDYRQESESPSTITPLLTPSSSLSSLLCSFLLVSWLLIGSIAFHHSRPRGWWRLFLRLVVRSPPPPIRILSPSSSRRAPPSTLRASRVTSRAHCPDLREDRNILLCPPVSSPSLPRGNSPRWHRQVAVCRTSIPNKVSESRDFLIFRSTRNLIPEFSQSLKSHELYFHNRKSRNPALKNTTTWNILVTV